MYQFQLIGEGSAKNFMVRYTANLTTNANGDVTAYHDYLDRLMVECR